MIVCVLHGGECVFFFWFCLPSKNVFLLFVKKEKLNEEAVLHNSIPHFRMTCHLPTELLERVLAGGTTCRLRGQQLLRNVLKPGRKLSRGLKRWVRHYHEAYSAGDVIFDRPGSLYLMLEIRSPTDASVVNELAITKISDHRTVVFEYECDKYLHGLSASYAHATTTLFADGRVEQDPVTQEGFTHATYGSPFYQPLTLQVV